MNSIGRLGARFEAVVRVQDTDGGRDVILASGPTRRSVEDLVEALPPRGPYGKDPIAIRPIPSGRTPPTSDLKPFGHR